MVIACFLKRIKTVSLSERVVAADVTVRAYLRQDMRQKIVNIWKLSMLPTATIVSIVALAACFRTY